MQGGLLFNCLDHKCFYQKFLDQKCLVSAMFPNGIPASSGGSPEPFRLHDTERDWRPTPRTAVIDFCL